MPSIDDVYNQLVTVNGRLQQINNSMVSLNSTSDKLLTCCNENGSRLKQILDSLNAGFANLSQGVLNMIQQQLFTNFVLVHLSAQTDTVICNLEKISEQTCGLLSEAHIQTGLQTEIRETSAAMMEMFKTVHPDAAVEFERREDLNNKILECCPPPEAKPLCTYEPCKAPRWELGEPPKPDYSPYKPVEGKTPK